jgi:hypothetical protein
MIANTLKNAVSVLLVIVTGGAWPNWRVGGSIAICACILAAVILHYVAP